MLSAPTSWLSDESVQKARGEEVVLRTPFLLPPHHSVPQLFASQRPMPWVHALLPSYGGESACRDCQHEDACKSVGNKIET